MDAEDLTLHNGGDAKVVEHLGAVLPRIRVSVLLDRLIVEAVDGCDLAGFMVTSKQGDVRWVLQLEAQQKLESFYRVISAVNIVAHENVAGVRDLAASIEELQQVVELTMDVTADGHGSSDGLSVALFDEDLFDLLAEDA